MKEGLSQEKYNESFYVVIIGAGMGGLCLAQGLKHKANIKVSVYERDRTRTGGLQGYRVGIGPNGSRALRECLPSDLFNIFIQTTARPAKYSNLLDEHLNTINVNEFVTPSDGVNDEKAVSRMTTRQILITGIEDSIHFDKKFVRYENTEKGSIKAYFSDGSSVECDLLVGADGSQSPVRKQYLPHAKVEDTGISAMFGKVAITEESKKLIPEKVFQGTGQIFAPNGYFLIMHTMEFKWDKNKKLKNDIGLSDRSLLENWPGMLYDNTSDYMMWGFTARDDKFKYDVKSVSPQQGTEMMVDMIRNWHPNVKNLIKMSDPGTVFGLKIRTSIDPGVWQPSRITLLGDAIHTMTPGRGSGANTALKDAQVLLGELTLFKNGDKTLLEAVGSYETQMRDYSSKLVAASRVMMDGKGWIHKPVLGYLMLMLIRFVFYLVNNMPYLKQAYVNRLKKERGYDKDKKQS